MSHLVDKLLGFPPGLALVLIFALPAAEASIFVGLFFPGELVILLGGVLANQHKLPLWSVLVIGSAGAIIGDTVGYQVGRHYGDRVLGKLPRRLVKPKHLAHGRVPFGLVPDEFTAYAQDKGLRRIGTIGSARHRPVAELDVDYAPVELEETFAAEDAQELAAAEAP